MAGDQPAGHRTASLLGAITLGTAGLPRTERAGVAHLLALSNDPDELAALLTLVKKVNREAIDRLTGDAAAEDSIHATEAALAIEANEMVIVRALEVLHEIDCLM